MQNGIPVIVEYKLLNEQIEPYSEEQKEAYKQIKNAKSYNEVTYIFSDDEIKPIMKAEALTDVKTEHNKLQTQIDEIKELINTTQTSAMLLDNLEKDLMEEV